MIFKIRMVFLRVWKKAENGSFNMYLVMPQKYLVVGIWYNVNHL